MENKLVDIERVVGEKNPALLKWAPKFLINYIKRIVHQDEINEILQNFGHLEGHEFARAIVSHFELELSTRGLENVPKDGGYIFVANHPLGGMDALSLIDQLYSVRKDLQFIANDILMHLRPLREFFVGVNKHGSNAQEGVKAINQAFADPHALFIFPAGLVSRKTRRQVRDLEWKKTFITRAKKYNKPVVPVFIDGELSPFFYRLSNIRKYLGIKANLEMLYLADELFKQKGKKIPIVFGKPIPSEKFDKTKTDKEWADWMKGQVYALADEI